MPAKASYQGARAECRESRSRCRPRPVRTLPDSRAATRSPASRTSAARCIRSGRRSWAVLRLLKHLLGQRPLATLPENLLGQLLFRGLRDVFLRGIWDQASKESDALDQLRDALRDQQEESDRYQQPRGPDDEATGIGGDLVALICIDEHGPREPHEENRHRQQEKQRAQNVDPCLRALRQPARDDVDAHMLVAQQRVAGEEQEDRREEVPLNLEQSVRAVVENLAHDGVGRADQYCYEHQPVECLPDALIQAIDEPGQRKEG